MVELSRRSVLLGAASGAALWGAGCAGRRGPRGPGGGSGTAVAGLNTPPILDPNGRRRPTTGRSDHLPPGFTWIKQEQDGLDRESALYVPPTAGPSNKVPLLFSIHGNGMQASSMFGDLKVGRVVVDQGWIGVFPETDVCAPTDPLPDQSDIRYLSALLDRLIDEYPVDTSRIWVTGFSGGGMKAYRMAAWRSDRVAAVYVNSGTIGYANGALAADWDPHLTGAEKVTIMHLHGSRDTVVPPRGGPVKEHGDISRLPVTDALAVWADAFGFDGGEQKVAPRGCPSSANAREWRGAGGYGITAIIDPDLGHKWAPYSNDVMVEFLKAAPTKDS